MTKHKLSTEFNKAAKREYDWGLTARNEKISEGKQAYKYPKGDPMRYELLMDSKLAGKFFKWRIGRSRNLKAQARKLKKVGL